MTVPVDTSGDWQIIEGLEDVTFFTRLLEGTFNAGVSTQAKRMPLTKGEMPGNENLTIYGVVWYVWKDLLPDGVVPKYSDKIVDAYGYGFQVIKIDIVSLGNRFRLVCLREP